MPFRKIYLTFGWKHRLCVIIHISFCLSLSLSCFLLLFLISPYLHFSSPFAPRFHSLLLLPLHNLAFGSLYIVFRSVLHPSGSLFSSIVRSFLAFSRQLCRPLLLSYSLSPSLSLRSQWVWLRAEWGVPPLSLAIKAMPTPRLHMSSCPSKRGGVLLIRSVSLSANTSCQMPICLFWLHTCFCLSLDFLRHWWKKRSIITSLQYILYVSKDDIWGLNMKLWDLLIWNLFFSCQSITLCFNNLKCIVFLLSMWYIYLNNSFTQKWY